MNRIKEFRDAKGWSLAQLAERVEPPTVAQQIEKLEKGTRRLTQGWMERLAKPLGVNPEDFIATGKGKVQQAPSNDLHKIITELPSMLRAVPIELGPPDLPVLGKAAGGKSGVLMLPVEPEPIDWTHRPPQLRGVNDAFAIYAFGDSMHPMYKRGQTLLVHPHQPLATGDGVLIVKNNDEAIIKEFVSENDDAITVLEYKPEERSFKIARTEIRHIYRIVGAHSL